MTRSLFLVLLLAATAPVSLAQSGGTKPVSDKTLSEFTIGEIISGDPVEVEKLEGKVVAIEFWGRL